MAPPIDPDSIPTGSGWTMSADQLGTFVTEVFRQTRALAQTVGQQAGRVIQADAELARAFESWVRDVDQDWRIWNDQSFVFPPNYIAKWVGYARQLNDFAARFGRLGIRSSRAAWDTDTEGFPWRGVFIGGLVIAGVVGLGYLLRGAAQAKSSGVFGLGGRVRRVERLAGDSTYYLEID